MPAAVVPVDAVYLRVPVDRGQPIDVDRAQTADPHTVCVVNVEILVVVEVVGALEDGPLTQEYGRAVRDAQVVRPVDALREIQCVSAVEEGLNSLRLILLRVGDDPVPRSNVRGVGELRLVGTVGREGVDEEVHRIGLIVGHV